MELGSHAVKDNHAPRSDFRTYLKHQVAQSFFVAPATCDEISSIVRALPSKPYCDCNGLSIKLLKHFVNTIINPLCTIVNKRFTNDIFPNSLKIAKIVPIFKAGDRNDVPNYRPISLLPIFSKVLEKLMLARLSTFIYKNNVLNAHQHGFRPLHSINSFLTDVLDYITAALDRKYVALALFIDVSKAFNSLNHNILLSKLEHCDIRSVAFSSFRSFLCNRFQYIELSNDRWLLRLIVSGVPHGSILGFYLYLIYVNDIFNVCNKVKRVLYADDTALILIEPNIKSVFDRAPALFMLFSTWFIDNKLALNSKKTDFVLFSSCNEAVLNKLSFDLNTVCKVDSVKYLGFFLDSRLSWREHIHHVKSKVSRGIGMIKFCYNFLSRNVFLLYIILLYILICLLALSFGAADIEYILMN